MQKKLDLIEAFFKTQNDVLQWGITSAQQTPHAQNLQKWIQGEQHAGLQYMAQNLEKRMHPEVFQPWAKSILVLALAYPKPLQTLATNGYQIAAYAQGADYHYRGKEILMGLENELKKHLGDFSFYAFTDTAPVFERDLASEAGLGWRGKNCCTLDKKNGSAFFLAGCFLPWELPHNNPVAEFCGGCTLCLDHCPTQAFSAPGQLNANKCISYWTIEAKTFIPVELSEQFGPWIFGCDICQAICPWNKKHLGDCDAASISLSGCEWLELLRKGGGFQRRFKHTPLARAGRKGLLRNVAIAARNNNDTETLTLLQAILPEENEEWVRVELERTIQHLCKL